MPQESGNNGAAYVRHNDEVDLVEDEDDGGLSDSATSITAPIAAASATASATASTSASTAAAKSKKKAKTVRGGTNDTASNQGTVPVATDSNVNVLRKLQDKACELLDRVNPHALAPPPAPAASSTSALTFEQQMQLMERQQQILNGQLELARLQHK